MSGRVFKVFSYLPVIFRAIWNQLLYRFRLGSFGFFSFIERGANIVGGKGISIGKMVHIERNSKMWCIFQYGANSYSPNLIIGDNVRIAQNLHCTCAESVEIGEGTSITPNCGIFDIVHPYTDVNINPRFANIETKPVKIGKNCLIGMNTVIHPGTQLGNHCVVGANSSVFGSFPDFCVIVGSPAKIVRRYDPNRKEWVRV